MARHSFIQMSKLPNVRGRISYITSHARQENLYATYRTADNTFWDNLAKESQQEFKRSGADGKCIEARALIIALPEVYTQYEPQQVLEDFTEEFHKRYGVECVSALHHASFCRIQGRVSILFPFPYYNHSNSKAPV